MTLPAPGPGRPQHPSYSEPQSGLTLLELAIFILAVVFIGALLALGEAVI